MKKRLRPRVPLVIAPFAPGHQNEFRGHSFKKLTKQIVKKNGGSQDQPGPARTSGGSPGDPWVGAPLVENQ